MVFRTFTTVHYTTEAEASSYTTEGQASSPTLLLDGGEDAFIRDAVPFGDSQILVAMSEAVVLYELDGTEVWSIPMNGSGDFISRGATKKSGGAPVDAWWMANAAGQLLRIPLDGSDPIVIEIPDAVFVNVPEGRRGRIRVAPIEGGAWFTNADRTIQFVSNDGELGVKVEVGPDQDDGVHLVDGKELNAYEGYVYATDANGTHYKIRGDGSEPPETSTDGFEVPFTEGAGLLWFFTDLSPAGDFANTIEGRDSDGETITEFGIPPGQGKWWTWGRGSLWIADQIGYLIRIGPRAQP